MRKVRQNHPKWGPWGSPGGIFGPLGCQNGSWRGKLAPRWGKLGPKWAKTRSSWGQGASRRRPKGAKWSSQGLFASFLDHLGAKMLICWNTSVSYMKTSIDNGCATPPPPDSKGSARPADPQTCLATVKLCVLSKSKVVWSVKQSHVIVLSFRRPTNVLERLLIAKRC